MNNFNISQELFSEIFWRRIFEEQGARHGNLTTLFNLHFDRAESREQLVDEKTGSIQPLTGWALYNMVRYFQPDRIMEIGTYIGKSTVSMAAGIYDSGRLNDKVPLHTCDRENDIEILWQNPYSCELIQYKKKTSTEMLRSLKEAGSPPFDFVNLDGRLSEDKDMDMFIDLIDLSKTVICLDDFEGIEKGMGNYIKLTKRKEFQNYLLVYNPTIQMANSIGFNTSCSLAVMLPTELVKFTFQ